MTALTQDDLGNHLVHIEGLLAAAKSDKELFQTIVNAPFYTKQLCTPLGLGLIVLLQVNDQGTLISRVAYSDTEAALGVDKIGLKSLYQLSVPRQYSDNLTVKAIDSGQPQHTEDWQSIYAPDTTPDEAHLYQAGAGIGCSCVYPLAARNGGALTFNFYLSLDRIGERQRNFMKEYQSIVAKYLAKPL